MLNARLINSELVKELFSAEFKKWVGPGRKLSVDECSALSSITRDTIESYRRGDNAPSLEKAIRLFSAIQESSFVNAVLSLCGYTGVHQIEADEQFSPSLMLSNIARRLALLARHMEDGHVDHRERLEELQELGELYAQLGEYLNCLRRAAAPAPIIPIRVEGRRKSDQRARAAAVATSA